MCLHLRLYLFCMCSSGSNCHLAGLDHFRHAIYIWGFLSYWLAPCLFSEGDFLVNLQNMFLSSHILERCSLWFAARHLHVHPSFILFQYACMAIMAPSPPSFLGPLAYLWSSPWRLQNLQCLLMLKHIYLI